MLDVMTESRKLERGRYGARRQASEKVPCVAASSMCSLTLPCLRHQYHTPTPTVAGRVLCKTAVRHRMRSVVVAEEEKVHSFIELLMFERDH